MRNGARARERTHPCLCFNLRQAARQVGAFYDAHLAKAGLTQAQFALLAEIAAGGEVPISEIADRLVLDPSTLSRTLRPLETAGLIELLKNEENRRQRLVRLTGEGRGRLREGVQAWQAAQAGAMTSIPEGLVLALLEGSGRLPAVPAQSKTGQRKTGRRKTPRLSAAP